MGELLEVVGLHAGGNDVREMVPLAIQLEHHDTHHLVADSLLAAR